MIRANRNNQRRAQRRSEQAKAEEEEEEEVLVEVEVAEGGKGQEEIHTDHPEEETEKSGSNRIEEKEDNVGAEEKAEELKQKHGTEGASSPQLSLHCETTAVVGNNSKDAQKSESNEAVTTEAREEAAGLVYIDYSQFDEDEEVDGSSYGLGGSTYHLDGSTYPSGRTYLGGRSEDSYDLSQAGVASVDTDPIGMTDEKVKILIKRKLIEYFCPAVQRCFGGFHREDQLGSHSTSSKLVILLFHLIPQSSQSLKH